MSDYYTQATIKPFVAENLLTDQELEMLQDAGIESEPAEGDTIYLFISEYYIEDEIVDKNGKYLGLVSFLRSLINRSPDLDFFTVEFAYTCSKMDPDAFGGSALFVTACDDEWLSTATWLSEKIEKHNANSSST